jgi:hypothetical protein
VKRSPYAVLFLMKSKSAPGHFQRVPQASTSYDALGNN